MIRIFLKKKTKDEIEEILLKDQKNSETGIFKQIENNSELLKETAPNLYNFLYKKSLVSHFSLYRRRRLFCLKNKVKPCFTHKERKKS